jgi:ATP-binding protein involved in chromosome partitioning
MAEKLPGIKHIVAVASGKGGVGKSTVSTNLALALAPKYKVGLVDCDILGPSIPQMVGLPKGLPPRMENQQAHPAECHGIKVMSMAMLTGDDDPAILRGPMVTRYLQMFIQGVIWGELDYLILDLPPGTGDVQLTLAQSTPLSGALIVTTPQKVSLNIARRGLRMFQKVQVPILGVVENMSSLNCPECDHSIDVFGAGGGEAMSQELEVPFLGAIPLDGAVVHSGDQGKPIVVDDPECAVSKAYQELARSLAEQLEGQGRLVIDHFVWQWEPDDPKPPWQPDAALGASGQADIPVGFQKKGDRTLTAMWQDGKQHDFDVRDLRLACPCAVCVDEGTGEKILDPASVPADIAPKVIVTVGSYAISVGWSDEHDSGIYSYELLRRLGDMAEKGVMEV